MARKKLIRGKEQVSPDIILSKIMPSRSNIGPRGGQRINF